MIDPNKDYENLPPEMKNYVDEMFKMMKLFD
jgi:hypothetical protein